MKLSWSLETRENDAIDQIFGTHWEHSVTSRKWKVECWVDNRSRILYFRKNMISWFGNSFSSCIYSSANMKKTPKNEKKKIVKQEQTPYQNVISKLGISSSSFIDSSTNMDKAPDCSVKKQTIPTRAYFRWFQDFWAEGWTQQCLSRNILEEMTWRWY